jgi:hypothetical protein
MMGAMSLAKVTAEPARASVELPKTAAKAAPVAKIFPSNAMSSAFSVCAPLRSP